MPDLFQPTSTMLEPPPQVLFRALLEDHLMSFTQFAFEVVRPGIAFRSNWHLEAMTFKLAQIASGEIRRLIINVPPRNSKSLALQ